MAEELAVYRVKQDGVKVGGTTRNKGDLVTLDSTGTEADICTRNGLIEKTKKEASSEKAPEVEDLGEPESGETPEPQEEIWDEIDEELNEEQPTELPPKWKPSEKDKHPDLLKGIVDRTGPDKYGKSLIVEDLDGDEWFIPSGRKALEDFMKKAEVGDRVGLKFLGMQESGETGRKYENYQTVVKKSD